MLKNSNIWRFTSPIGGFANSTIPATTKKKIECPERFVHTTLSQQDVYYRILLGIIRAECAEPLGSNCTRISDVFGTPNPKIFNNWKFQIRLDFQYGPRTVFYSLGFQYSSKLLLLSNFLKRGGLREVPTRALTLCPCVCVCTAEPFVPRRCLGASLLNQLSSLCPFF